MQPAARTLPSSARPPRPAHPITHFTTTTMQACRNSVPVPRHWSQKRKYLQVRLGCRRGAC